MATCLVCGEGHYIVRTNRISGVSFWGCSRFPKCNATLSFAMIDPESNDLKDAAVSKNSTARINAQAAEIRGRKVEPASVAEKKLSPSDVELVRRAARQTGRPRQGWSDAGPQLRVKASGYITRANLREVMDKLAPDFEKQADLYLMEMGVERALHHMPFASYARRKAYDEAWEEMSEFDLD